jgi:hypothetical protein
MKNGENSVWKHLALRDYEKASDKAKYEAGVLTTTA